MVPLFSGQVILRRDFCRFCEDELYFFDARVIFWDSTWPAAFRTMRPHSGTTGSSTSAPPGASASSTATRSGPEWDEAEADVLESPVKNIGEMGGVTAEQMQARGSVSQCKQRCQLSSVVFALRAARSAVSHD